MKNTSNLVLITASGSSTGLGELTKYTNKTLIRVGDKPTISHIIESYPKSAHFVITLGYYAKQVKDFLTLAYPKHLFTFVEVDKYEGKGSSMGYSMLKASKHLQQPFIFHASDTIVHDQIPKVISNWIGGYRGEGSSNYTSFNILNNKIQKILEKGIINPDFLHIGLVGVYDYKKFWKTLNDLYEKNTYGDALSDFHALNHMIEDGVDFKVKEITRWWDVGNIDSLKKTRQDFKNPFNVLDKPRESIFIFNDSVIKFFHDESMVRQRVKRAENLKGLVPKIKKSLGNFYIYNYIDGDLYADVATPANFSDFLLWSKKNLWKRVHETSVNKFKNICYDFYFTKTQERIAEFLLTRNMKDTEIIINDEKVPSFKDMLKQIDFDWLSTTDQSRFHGDYILDNIIKTKKGYVLVDWRQNFGGLTHAGDMYYDLAKLNHNLTINHGIVSKELFTINVGTHNVYVDIHRKETLVECQKVLFKFLDENKLDKKKVKMLTAIAWLNMSPLHEHPYDTFLYYFGKLQLWRAIKEVSDEN